MELRQTIQTGIRNIGRAWWEPVLMLAISALLVAAAWPWRRRCSSPRTWRRTFWRRSMGRCPARACERRGPAREGWRMLVSIDGCWKAWYAKSVRETDG